MTQRLRNLQLEAESLPKAAGRQGVITAIRNRLRFCNMHKMSDREIELFVNESRREIDGILAKNKKGAGNTDPLAKPNWKLPD